MSEKVRTLREVAAEAEKLAPSPWRTWWTGDAYDMGFGVDFITDANHENVVVADSGSYPPYGAVAEHIARCSPAVVLALLDRIRQLRWALREAIELARELCDDTPDRPVVARLQSIESANLEYDDRLGVIDVE